MFYVYQNWLEQMLERAKDQFDVYAIELRRNTNKFFVVDVNNTDTITSIIWTPRLSQAQLFFSEEAVEEFKSDYISPRKVSIIRMSSLDAIIRSA